MVIRDINITEPCRLCRKESINISGNKKYCVECYKELIVNVVLGKKQTR